MSEARVSPSAGFRPAEAHPLERIQPGVRGQVEALRNDFQSGQPFRHVVIDDFLAPEFSRQLIREFPGFDREHALNEFGEVGGKAVFQNLPRLGPAYEAFDRLMQSAEFLSFIGEITGIPELRYDPEYVGGGTHENLNGQELDPHIDFNYHPATKLHRRLNLILFLNPEWREEFGGSLELHLDPWLPPEENRIKSVLPKENRCVIFETSEHSWHGFKKIQVPGEYGHLSRRSIAVYFYTKERPEPETAPDHSTVYVPRPRASHIKAGYTLREEDVAEIDALLARRDAQIKFLYQRELRFQSELRRIFRSPTFRLASLLAWPLRQLRKRGRDS